MAQVRRQRIDNVDELMEAAVSGGGYGREHDPSRQYEVNIVAGQRAELEAKDAVQEVDHQHNVSGHHDDVLGLVQKRMVRAHTFIILTILARWVDRCGIFANNRSCIAREDVEKPDEPRSVKHRRYDALVQLFMTWIHLPNDGTHKLL